jgi:hypothetical protein
MKTGIALFLSILIQVQAHADCRPMIESELEQKILRHGKLVKAGKITTGTVFVTVGGFYGTMGVILLGPLWAGAVVGATFGVFAGAPVGTTFIIVSKIQKARIRNLGRTLSVIGSGEELLDLHERLLVHHPDLTLPELESLIFELNETRALCDGTVSGRSRKIATPREIYRYVDRSLSPD